MHTDTELLGETWENPDDSSEEMEGEEEGFSEEEGLSDIEDISEDGASEADGSIHDPFLCVQPPAGGAVGATSQGGFLGGGLTDEVQQELQWRLGRLEIERGGTARKRVEVEAHVEGEEEAERDRDSPQAPCHTCHSMEATLEVQPVTPCTAAAGGSPAVKTEAISAAAPTLLTSLDIPRGSEAPSPPLTPSLFPGIPPTIHFPLPNEPCK